MTINMSFVQMLSRNIQYMKCVLTCVCRCVALQFVETISSKQTELDTFIAEGYKTALSEERRRYCFLVDRQCAVAKNSSAYHGKVSPGPQDGSVIPDRIVLLKHSVTLRILGVHRGLNGKT